MLTTTENGLESCMDTKKRTGEVLTAATNEEVGPLTNSFPTGRLRLTRVLREASFSHVVFTSSSSSFMLSYSGDPVLHRSKKPTLESTYSKGLVKRRTRVFEITLFLTLVCLFRELSR